MCCSLLISGIKIKGVNAKCESICCDVRMEFVSFYFIQFHGIDSMDRSFGQTAYQTVNVFMRIIIIIRKHFMTCYHLLFGIEICLTNSIESKKTKTMKETGINQQNELLIGHKMLMIYGIIIQFKAKRAIDDNNKMRICFKITIFRLIGCHSFVWSAMSS